MLRCTYFYPSKSIFTEASSPKLFFFKCFYTYLRIIILKHLVISVNNSDLKLMFYIREENRELIDFSYVMQDSFLRRERKNKNLRLI